MALLKVYNGSAWKTAVAKVWNGSAWVGVAKFYDGTAWQTLSLTVSPSSAASNNLRFGATCWAGLRFESNGTEDGLTNSGAYTVSRGNWLDSGSASSVWVQRTIDLGTLTFDPGSGRLQLSTTREFYITQTFVGTKNTTVTFKFYDAASGGNQIGQSTVAMTAAYSISE